MASLQQDPSGNYHICFRFGSNRFKRSLRTRNRRKAEAMSFRVEENIGLVESGNGRINSAGASTVASVAASLDTGFSASLLTDPILVGDFSGNRRINGFDASMVAQFAGFLNVPEIPPVPAGIVITERAFKVGPGLTGGPLLPEARLSGSTAGPPMSSAEFAALPMLATRGLDAWLHLDRQLDQQQEDELLPALEEAIEELSDLDGMLRDDLPR